MKKKFIQLAWGFNFNTAQFNLKMDDLSNEFRINFSLTFATQSITIILTQSAFQILLQKFFQVKYLKDC